MAIYSPGELDCGGNVVGVINQTMARLLTTTNLPLPNSLTLIAGSPYTFKVSGLGLDKRHVLMKSSSAAVAVVVVSANDRNIEQTLRLEPVANLESMTQATLSGYLESKPTQKDGMTATVALTIEPKVKLPAEATEAGILTRVLLAENITPGDKAFSAEESLQTMQWMRQVLLNRLKFGPRYFGAGRNAATLAELIKGTNQVKDFEGYPNIQTGAAVVINDVLRYANTSGYTRSRLYRQYVRDAIDVASGIKPGTDPSPTGLYAWRTAGSRSPGENFVRYKSYGGQDFYTLTDSFRSDPLQRSKPR